MSGATHTSPPETAALSSQDRRDLERYFAFLRAQYAIPADRSVFPASPCAPRQSRRSTRQAQTVSRNPASHPWRAQLSGGVR